MLKPETVIPVQMGCSGKMLGVCGTRNRPAWVGNSNYGLTVIRCNEALDADMKINLVLIFAFKVALYGDSRGKAYQMGNTFHSDGPGSSTGNGCAHARLQGQDTCWGWFGTSWVQPPACHTLLLLRQRDLQVNGQANKPQDQDCWQTHLLASAALRVVICPCLRQGLSSCGRRVGRGRAAPAAEPWGGGGQEGRGRAGWHSCSPPPRSPPVFTTRHLAPSASSCDLSM